MEHQIHTLLKVSLENINEMLDVNTIIGDPIEYNDYTVVPISKVKVNFLSGGSEFNTKDNALPFGGATGGSVTVSPVAFLVLTKDDARLLQIGQTDGILEKIMESLPDIVNSVKKMLNKEDKLVNNS